MDYFRDIWFIENVFRPLLDVGILSFLIYQIYRLIAQTRAVQLLKGAFFLLIIYAVAFFFHLETLLWIMHSLATVLVIVVAIVFQPELRAIFTRIGRGDLFKLSTGANVEHIETVVNALEVLAGRKRGALIVFPRQVGLKNLIDNGTRLNAELSSSLIITIFGYDTPLHDGAAVVQGGRLISAGCFLPLSEQIDIRRSFGTRHRAALGMAEETDSVILVLSEETGALSLAYDANLHYDLSAKEVSRTLRNLLTAGGESAEDSEDISVAS
ncbi:MAG TPA: TIGR00159 family protein [Sediminispirochaeta sp.]|nr:TIGR00159 family protein [Sediminispirochaeta sp.]